MSLVGPRPERPVFIHKFTKSIPSYMARHRVKAGITGWAQVNGWRGNTSLRKRIQYDLYYITHWTPWLDIRILFLTIWHGFVNRNAYCSVLRLAPSWSLGAAWACQLRGRVRVCYVTLL